MAEIHSFIYGIDANSTIRKVAVSREAGTTYMTLNPPHGSDAVPVREIVERGQLPWLALFDLYEAVEIPADLDETAVGEKIRADLEVKAVARQAASG
jgi:hypothetical protein